MEALWQSALMNPPAPYIYIVSLSVDITKVPEPETQLQRDVCEVSMS